MSRFLKSWLPVLLWMMVIFYLSTNAGSSANTSRIIEPVLRWLMPHLSTHMIHQVHSAIRKVGHLAEYAALGWLLWRALRQTQSGLTGGSAWKAALAALVLSAAYAATDEFHQSFIPTRTPSVRDVMIDTGGSLFSVAIACTCAACRRKPGVEPRPSQTTVA
jgi:VanZ family protein